MSAPDELRAALAVAVETPGPSRFALTALEQVARAYTAARLEAAADRLDRSGLVQDWPMAMLRDMAEDERRG